MVTRLCRGPANESLISALQRHAHDSDWNDKVTFGAMLSGGAHIASTSYRDRLAKAFMDRGELVIGGEMEGVGLISASPPDNPSWIVVKGICDFADEERAEVVKKGRKSACSNSARFVLEALKRAD